MLAKIIAQGKDREAARKQLLDALGQTVLFGLQTNQDFLRALLAHPDFIANTIDTIWIANLCDADGCYNLPPPTAALLALASVIWCQLNEPAQIEHIAWEVADVKERFSVSVKSEATTDYKVDVKSETVAVKLLQFNPPVATLELADVHQQVIFGQDANARLHLATAERCWVLTPKICF